MRKYRSLLAWQRARALTVATLKTTDRHHSSRTLALFDQIRRAVISVEANIVEGYALGTAPQFRRHLRIAVASGAEAETLVEVVGEMGYLPANDVASLLGQLDGVMRSTYGLIKSGIAHRRV
ncbi:MAG: four helix bundle protein [Gemmatimonadales bacterium]